MKKIVKIFVKMAKYKSENGSEVYRTESYIDHKMAHEVSEVSERRLVQ
jgi:hypothetical protein